MVNDRLAYAIHCPRCGMSTDLAGEVILRGWAPDGANIVTSVHQCRRPTCAHMWVPAPPAPPRWPQQPEPQT